MILALILALFHDHIGTGFSVVNNIIFQLNVAELPERLEPPRFVLNPRMYARYQGSQFYSIKNSEHCLLHDNELYTRVIVLILVLNCFIATNISETSKGKVSQLFAFKNSKMSFVHGLCTWHNRCFNDRSRI